MQDTEYSLWSQLLHDCVSAVRETNIHFGSIKGHGKIQKPLRGLFCWEGTACVDPWDTCTFLLQVFTRSISSSPSPPLLVHSLEGQEFKSYNSHPRQTQPPGDMESSSPRHWSNRFRCSSLISNSVGFNDAITLCSWSSLLSSRRERHRELRFVIHYQAQDLRPSIVAHNIEVEFGPNNFSQVCKWQQNVVSFQWSELVQKNTTNPTAELCIKYTKPCADLQRHVSLHSFWRNRRGFQPLLIIYIETKRKGGAFLPRSAVISASPS